MKRFAFSLERVLGFRRQQEELERARLERLAADRARLQSRAGELLKQSRLARAGCAATLTMAAGDLRLAYEYALSLGRARRETLAQAKAVEVQHREQLTAVLQTRRKVRLLELLRARKAARHARLVGREQESLAGELHLAAMRRERDHPTGEPKKL